MIHPNVLIVEDDKDFSYILGKLFRAWDWDVFLADTVQHAIESLPTVRPDLILLDVRLPDGSGIEVLKRIKELGLSSPVCVMTSNDTSSLTDIMEYSPTRVFQKPIAYGEFEGFAESIKEKKLKS